MKLEDAIKKPVIYQLTYCNVASGAKLTRRFANFLDVALSSFTETCITPMTVWLSSFVDFKILREDALKKSIRYLEVLIALKFNINHTKEALDFRFFFVKLSCWGLALGKNESVCLLEGELNLGDPLDRGGLKRSSLDLVSMNIYLLVYLGK